MNSKVFPSIFNDCIAPATQGPSSSNTVGPYRIGSLARNMLKGKPVYLKFEMCAKGGFYDTFFSMESDKGLLLGIMEKELLSFDLGQVYAQAEAEGLTYDFEFTDRIEPIPTEMGELTLRSETEEIVLTGISLGGGEILISEVNGEKTEIQGRRDEYFTPAGFDEPRLLKTVYPFRAQEDCKPIFTTSQGMLEYCKTTGKPMWQVALDYECSVIHATEEEVLAVAKETLDRQNRAIEKGFGEVSFDGVTVAKAPQVREMMKTHKLISTGAGAMGGLEALAIMEYSNSHGIITCMPTGGATGVVVPSIKAAASDLGLGEEDQIKALLVAGLIGTFFYPTHYHGALGCQAEIGIATSMASAGLASMITDDCEAIERAAVLGIQYLLGQVCDPVMGYPQVPCFIRNIASVSVAAVCANYGVLGIDTCVSIDEMVDAVIRVGEALKKDRINDLGVCGCKCISCNPLSQVAKRETEK